MLIREKVGDKGKHHIHTLQFSFRLSSQNIFMYFAECCVYEGKMYKSNQVVYNTTDGMGGCIVAYCIDQKIVGSITPCTTTAPTTVFSFSTTSTVSTTTAPVTGNVITLMVKLSNKMLFV